MIIIIDYKHYRSNKNGALSHNYFII